MTESDPLAALRVRLAALVQQRDALVEAIRWALGESSHEEFPPLPDDWPKRKFYWRPALRAKLDAALAAVLQEPAE